MQRVSRIPLPKGRDSMFAGHFGIAAAVKATQPRLPLWSLIVATQLLDILFIPLNLAGVERTDTSIGTGYGETIFHADYTHSLVGALLIAVVAGFAARRAWGAKGGYAIASVVFSHWLLDLIVHRADMPILPGNAGELPLLGFGLWKYAGISMILETAILAIGFAMYVRYAMKGTGKTSRKKATASVIAMGLFLALTMMISV